MAKKKQKTPKETDTSDNSTSKKSEEYLRFENAVRAIFSLSPEEAKKIRKSKLPKDPLVR